MSETKLNPTIKLSNSPSNGTSIKEIFEKFYLIRNKKVGKIKDFESFCERNKSFFKKEYSLNDSDYFRVTFENQGVKKPEYGFMLKMPFSDPNGVLYGFYRTSNIKKIVKSVSKMLELKIREIDNYYHLVEGANGEKSFNKVEVEWSSVNFYGDVPSNSVSEEVIESKKCGAKATTKIFDVKNIISEQNRIVENHINDENGINFSVEVLSNLLKYVPKIPNKSIISIFKNSLAQREYFIDLQKN